MRMLPRAALLACQFWLRAGGALPVVLAMLVAVCGHASGHSWYPYSCCSELDCFPVSVARDEIERRDGGWYLKKERITIPFDAARASPDRHFHICRNEMGRGTLITPSGQPPCFWVPEAEN